MNIWTIAATITTTILLGLGVWVWYFYTFMLPAVLAGMAKRTKWVTTIPENSVAPVENNGKFSYMIIHYAGHTLSNPSSVDAGVISGTTKETFWSRRGLFWLGFGAPAQTNLGSLTIPANRYNKEEKGGLEKQFSSTPKEIHSLRLNFVRYVLVRNVETTDGYEATYLVQAFVKVEVPWKLWYALGGKAYETLDTAVSQLVRVEGEKCSINKMYTGDHQDLFEAAILPGITDPYLIEKTGATISKIILEEWDDNAPEDYLAQLRAGDVEAQRRRAELARQQTALEVTNARKKVTIAETELAEKQEELNKKTYEALLALCGGDKDNRDLVTMTLMLHQLGGPGPAFDNYLRTRAFEKTGVQVLGGSATELASIIFANQKKGGSD